MVTYVNISWIIPSFIEEEEYYIIYGLDSDKLEFISDSIESVSNVSLENQTYSLVVGGLEAATIYYGQIVAAFGGMSLEYKRYSNMFVFRTKENGENTWLRAFEITCFLLHRASHLSGISASC